MMAASNDKTMDPMDVEPSFGSNYPPEFAGVCEAREKRRLGDVFGLNNFGVNLVRLPPGQASANRHWHSAQDEFIYILEGEATLVTDAGETPMGPGTMMGFPANVPDGHGLINNSDGDVLYLEVGDRSGGDEVDYPDIDLQTRFIDGERRYVHKDGTPYD
jgi:uncharacterized cupin superfamily protein